MSIPAIQNDLSTPEGFASRVKVPNGALIAGLTMLGVGVVFVVWNLIEISYAFGQPYFWQAFFSTASEGSGRGQAFIFIRVWGPLVLVPLGIIFTIIGLTTRKNKLSGTYADYQARGFVASQQPAGFALPLGEKGEDVQLALLAAPGVTAEQFGAAVNGLYGRVSTLDKKAAKELAKAARGAQINEGGVLVRTLFPEIPGDILLAPQKGTGQIVAVIPGPSGLGSAKSRILEIKQ